LTTTISINELSKFFGDTKAVNGVSLDVKRGEVFGFLGPNAAGKSTTVKVAATLLCPTKGTILVDGYDVQTDPVEVRSAIGLLPEDGATTHYDRLSAYQNLEYFGRLYDVPEEMLHDRIIQLLEFLELADRAEDSPATYSTGLKQKLSLARSLIHDPSVVFLDEPTSSLDPIMSRRIRQFIDQQAEAGKQTFFLCTHLLSEFEHLCDRVGFIVEGKLTLIESPKELKIKHGKKIVKLEYLKNDELVSQEFDLKNLAGNNNFLSLLRTGTVQTIHTEEASLEDIFIKATGRHLK